MADGQLVIEALMDDKNFNKQVKKIEDSLEDIGKASNEVSKSMESDIDKVIKAFKEEEKAIEKLNKEIKKLSNEEIKIEIEAVNNAEKTIEKVSSDLKVLDNIATIAEIEADSTDAINDIDKVNAELETLEGKKATAKVDADAQDAIADINTVESELATVDGETATAKVKVDTSGAVQATDAVESELADIDGTVAQPKIQPVVDTSGMEQAINDVEQGLSSIVATGAGLTAFGVIASDTFREYETWITQIGTLTTAEFEEIDAIVQEVSQTFGVDMVQSAQALYAALSAGVDVFADVEQGMMFLSSAHDLAVLGMTDLTTAVEVLTSVMAAYGLGIDEVTEIVDTFVIAQAVGNTTVNQMAGSMSDAIVPAANLGIEFQEVSAALAAITLQGTPTSKAITQLEQLFSTFANTTNKLNKQFMQFTGMTIPQFIEQGGTLAEVMSIINQITEETGMSMIELMGSSEAANAAMSLLASSGVSAYNEALVMMQDETDNASQAMSAFEETAAVKSAKAAASIQGMTSVIGEAFSDMRLKIQEAIAGIAEAFLALPESTQKAIANFIVLTSVLLVVGGAFALLITIVKGIMSTFSGLTKSIGSVGTSFLGLGKATDETGKKIVDVDGKTKGLGKTLINLLTPTKWITLAIGAFTAFLANNEEAVAKLKEAIGKLVDALKPLFSALKDFLVPILEVAIDLFETLKPLLEKIGNFINDVLIRAIELLTDALEGLTDVVNWLNDNVLQPFLEILYEIADVIADILSAGVFNVMDLGEAEASASVAVTPTLAPMPSIQGMTATMPVTTDYVMGASTQALMPLANTTAMKMVGEAIMANIPSGLIGGGTNINVNIGSLHALNPQDFSDRVTDIVDVQLGRLIGANK